MRVVAVAVVAVASVIRMRHHAVETCSKKSAWAESSERGVAEYRGGRRVMRGGAEEYREMIYTRCRTAERADFLFLELAVCGGLAAVGASDLVERGRHGTCHGGKRGVR